MKSIGDRNLLPATLSTWVRLGIQVGLGSRYPSEPGEDTRDALQHLLASSATKLSHYCTNVLRHSNQNKLISASEVFEAPMCP